MGDFGTILQIGDVLVSEEVITEFFACDYDKCQGACCIEGDSGAPLEDAETGLLERHYPTYAPLMTEEGREAVDAKGFFEVDVQGDVVTPLACRGACAFVHPGAGGSYLCAIEKSYLSGKCPWRKPVSCSLYPIRVSRLTGGGAALNLHRWGICADAFAKGRREGVRVYQFLRDPLVECYGADFYDALCAGAEMVLKSCPPRP